MTYDKAWKDLEQGDSTVGDFITLSEAVFKMLEDRGGEHSDQQRISTFMQSVTLATESALVKHVKDLEVRGEYDDVIYSGWGLFSNTMDRIGQSMEVADVEEKYANYEFEDKDDRFSLDGQPECLQWDYTGNCDRAPNGGQCSCRYKHLQSSYTAGTRATKLSGVQRMKKIWKRGRLRRGERYMALMIHHKRGSGIAA